MHGTWFRNGTQLKLQAWGRWEDFGDLSSANMLFVLRHLQGLTRVVGSLAPDACYARADGSEVRLTAAEGSARLTGTLAVSFAKSAESRLIVPSSISIVR